MTEPAYPAPPPLSLADLDPATVTTDRLIALVRSHRAGEAYPTAEVLLGYLPKVPRALGDHAVGRSDGAGRGVPAGVPDRCD